MTTTKPIVVGVNGSRESHPALIWAVLRAARLGLQVVAVHAVDDRWISDEFAYHDLVRERGSEILKDAQDRATAAAPSVDFRTELLSGGVGSALRKYSARATMLVIGSGGADRPGGPLTDRALQLASVARCPVAVIGSHGTDNRHGVVVGVDGSEESTQAVAFAAAEADRESQELTIVHAFRGPNRWLQARMPESSLSELIVAEERIVLSEAAAGLAEEYPDLVVTKVLETEKEPAEALVDAAANARLLVVGSRGRGGFKRLLLGSTAHGVLKDLPCPTIVTRVRPVRHTE